MDFSFTTQARFWEICIKLNSTTTTWLQRTGAYWKQIMDKKQFSGSKCIAHSAIFLFKVTHQPFEVEVADLEQMSENSVKITWTSCCIIYHITLSSAR